MSLIPKLVQARPSSTVEAAAEIGRALLTRSVPHDRCNSQNAIVHSRIACQLGRWIAGRGHSEERFLDVTILEGAVPPRLISERSGKAVGDRFIGVGRAGLDAELD